MRKLLLLLCLVCGAQTALGQDTEALRRYLESGQTDSARVLVERLRVAGAGTDVYYYLGRLSASDGEARRHFRKSMQSGGSLAADAQFELAESAYADARGLYVTARRSYQAFVDGHPTSPHIPLALYRIGRTYQITAASRPDSLNAHLDAARKVYLRILDAHPNAPIAKSAAVALVEADHQANDSAAAERNAQRIEARPQWMGEVATFERLGKKTTQTAVADAPVTSGAYWVQVGVFANEAGIQALVKRLRENALPTRLVASGARTIIRVGPYETEDRAERVSRHISTVESIACRVIQE